MAAYRRLMEEHGQAALRSAYLVTRNLPDAEDVLQEAFVKAFRALPRFEARSSFKTWLLRIVTNEALNLNRGRTRRLRVEERLAEDRSRGFDESAPRDALWDALAKLPADERALLGCRFFLDLSQEETAQTLGIPLGTVKSRQAAAVGRLRALLTETELETADD